MAKIIRMSLTSESIQNAIREIEAYRNSLKERTNELCRRLAERIGVYAREGFASAPGDTTISGGPRSANVSVTVEPRGNCLYVITAAGEDAVWAEFGAGIHYNGGAGTSPHPKGAELGFVIGGYGKGNGARQVWGYWKDGELVLTRGTPASMPLYNALVRARNEIAEVAMEVFGR